MSIYTIDREILELVDPETGEISDWEAFEQLQMERDTKIENAACFYKNTIAEAAAIKAEEDVLKRRREVLENRSKRLKEYLEYATAGQGFQTPRCVITWRKNPPKVELSDPEQAIIWAQKNGHEDLVTYKQPDISKSGLAKLLKENVEIPGAKLVIGESMGVK